MVGEFERIRSLARRVAWLDRYRRIVAIAGAVVLGPWMISTLDQAIGAGIESFYATLLAIVVGFVVWCGLEVLFAWVTAVWETDCARLLRRARLPRAIARPSRPRWFQT